MIIDCISDLHGYYPKLEGGDLLIVAGDLTARDDEIQHAELSCWLKKQPYKKIVIISGNHDVCIQEEMYYHNQPGSKIAYLEDGKDEFEGLKIWGSPWSNHFKGMNPACAAFTGNEKLLEEKFNLIPNDTDILVTHTPPYGILDAVTRYPKFRVEFCGSSILRNRLNQIKPKLHVFGHIHEGHGISIINHTDVQTTCVNASIMNEVYSPVNKPIRIVL